MDRIAIINPVSGGAKGDAGLNEIYNNVKDAMPSD